MQESNSKGAPHSKALEALLRAKASAGHAAEQPIEEDAELLSECGQCGTAVSAEASLSRAYRCTCCNAWLFKSQWQSAENTEKCEACCYPVGEGKSCPFCGPPRGFFFRLAQLFLSWMTSFLVRGNRIVPVPISRIRGDGFQPRLSLEVSRFESLRKSIEGYGLIEPLLVRPNSSGSGWQVVCGHRRLLAIRQLGWELVPVRIVHLSEEEALAIRLSENLHREQLSSLELAESFERYFLVRKSGDREQIAKELGLPADSAGQLADLLKISPEDRERLIYNPLCKTVEGNS